MTSTYTRVVCILIAVERSKLLIALEIVSRQSSPARGKDSGRASAIEITRSVEGQLKLQRQREREREKETRCCAEPAVVDTNERDLIHRPSRKPASSIRLSVSSFSAS